MATLRFLFSRRFLLGMWLAIWPTLLAIHLYPIRFGMLRLLMVTLLFAFWIGALWICRANRALFLSALSISLLGILWLAAPGRPIESNDLARRCVNELRVYRGTPYVWGGETTRGIDCSGLVREGMIDALWQQGLARLNPAATRQSLILWWDDCSARELGAEYHGRSRYLFSISSLNDLDDPRIQPGDFAVTTSGVHTLAYLGSHTWIEADPSLLAGNSVVEVRTPSNNPWFRLPMRILRWSYVRGP